MTSYIVHLLEDCLCERASRSFSYWWKASDGLNLVSWQVGKNLVFDFTVADMLANSYLTSTSITGCSAVDLAASRKED